MYDRKDRRFFLHDPRPCVKSVYQFKYVTINLQNNTVYFIYLSHPGQEGRGFGLPSFICE